MVQKYVHTVINNSCNTLLKCKTNINTNSNKNNKKKHVKKYCNLEYKSKPPSEVKLTCAWLVHCKKKLFVSLI